MGEATKIEWATHTFNPWIGCTKVHEGCANCYAEKDFDKRRHVAKWGPHGTRVVTSEANWKQPEKWDREAEKAGVRRRVFCASLADVFEEWGGPVVRNDSTKVGAHSDGCLCPVDFRPSRDATLNDVRRGLFSLIDAAPSLDWLLLTKRPENVWRMWEPTEQKPLPDRPVGLHEKPHPQFRPNVWLGTSISTQEHADKQIPELLKCRELAPVLFLSIEPMLGPVDISQRLKMIDWVIVGGESGPNARPMHPDWVRSVRDQCQAAGVPFFFKQGSSSNWDAYKAFDKFPPDLQIRQFPAGASK